MPLSPRARAAAGIKDAGSVMLRGMTARTAAPACSGIAERQCDEFGAFVRLHPEQDGVLALAARLAQGLANLRRRRHRFAANFEDHITGLKAMLRGDAAGIDAGNHDAVAASARDLVAGRQLEAEIGHVAVGHFTLVALVRLIRR